MGVIIRQSSWAVVANYIGVVLGFVNVMLLMPAVLQPEQIGLINLIFSTAILIYPLMDFSANALLNRYFTHVATPQLMFNLSFLIMAGGAALFSLLFLIGKPVFLHYYADESPEIIPFYWMIYGLAAILALQNLFENYAIIHKKLHFSIFIREVVYRLFITAFIGMFFYGLLTFPTYLRLHYGSYLFATLLLILFLLLNRLFSFKWQLPDLGKNQLLDMGRFGSFMLLTGLTNMFAIRIDSLMLGSMKGLEDVGIYSLAMYMISLIEVPRRMLVQSSFPILRQAIHDGDWDNVANIQRKAILNLVLIAGGMLTLLLINMEDIYKVIPNGQRYQEGIWVVLFLGLARLVDMFNGANNEIFQASRHYRYVILFFVLLAISAIGFNYWLIPGHGFKGAALATLLTTLLVSMVRMGFFQRLFRLKIYSSKLLLVLAFLLLSGLAAYMIPLQLHPILSILARSSSFGLFAVIFVLLTDVSPDLQNLLRSIYAFLIRKGR